MLVATLIHSNQRNLKETIKSQLVKVLTHKTTVKQVNRLSLNNNSFKRKSQVISIDSIDVQESYQLSSAKQDLQQVVEVFRQACTSQNDVHKRLMNISCHT